MAEHYKNITCAATPGCYILGVRTQGDKPFAPNWEVVVAGGLVVAFLAEPERFIDTAGRLTSHAVAAFSELGIEVGASIAEGVLRGTWRSVERRLEQSLGWTLLALAMFLVAGWVFVARRLRTRKKTGRRP